MLSVNETLYPYHEAIGLKQYNTNKPAKYGVSVIQQPRIHITPYHRLVSLTLAKVLLLNTMELVPTLTPSIQLTSFPITVASRVTIFRLTGTLPSCLWQNGLWRKSSRLWVLWDMIEREYQRSWNPSTIEKKSKSFMSTMRRKTWCLCHTLTRRSRVRRMPLSLRLCRQGQGHQWSTNETACTCNVWSRWSWYCWSLVNRSFNQNQVKEMAFERICVCIGYMQNQC